MPPTPSLYPKIIDNKYTFLEKVGGGSFSDVLKVEGPHGLHALKLLKKGFGDRYHHESLADFKNEFSILKDLNHPHIARILDFGFDEALGQYYFTTELITGQDLFSGTQKCTTEEKVDYIVQALRALIYLHSYRIFHFDIKAANLLVTSGNPALLKIIDFGLATPDPQKKIMGTPSYMAPEIINHELPDGRADLYSLGVLFYYILTGLNPFRGKGVQETLSRQQSHTPPPPSSLNPDLPPYIDVITMRLLQKNPAYRYQRGEEVIEELNRIAPKKYPLETKDTLLSYLPEEGRLIGQKKQWRVLRGIFRSIFQEGFSKKETPHLALIKGAHGTGKSRLLKELKYFSQLDHVPVISGDASIEGDLDRFIEELKNSMGEKAEGPLLFLLDNVSSFAENSPRRNHLIGHLTRWNDHYSITSGPPRWIVLAGDSHEAWETDPWKSLIDQTFSLSNFSLEELTEYMISLTGLEDPPQELVQGIFHRSEGNPLLVTLVLRSLIQGGALFDEGGRWRSSTFEDIGVDFTKASLPDNLEGLLLLPYKQKDKESQHIVALMAVINKPLTLAELTSLMDGKKASSTPLSFQIQKLLKDNLLNRDENTKLYSFKNLLFSKILYHHLSLEKRQNLHDQIAAILQENRTVPFEEWGHHVSRGSDLPTAITISEKLGNYYLQRGWGSKASEYFEWATHLHPQDTNLLMKLGESYLIDHYYEKALAVFEKTIDLLMTQKNDPSWLSSQIDGMIRMGGVYLKMEAFDKARSCFEQARDILKTFPSDPIREMLLDNFHGYLLIHEGKLEDAENTFEQTLEKWQNDFSNDDKKKVTNNDLGMVYLLKHEHPKALKQFQSDLLFYKNLGDTLLTTRCHYHLAETYAALDNDEKTIQHYKTCALLCQKNRNKELLLRTYNGLGNVYIKKKDHDNSLQYYRRGLTLCENIGDMKSHAAISINMGLIHNQLKELDHALTYLQPAITFFKRIPNKSAFDWFYLYRGLLEIADVKRQQKSFDESESLLDEALTTISQSESLTQQKFWVYAIKCELAIEQGQDHKAKRWFQQLNGLTLDAEQRHKLTSLKELLEPLELTSRPTTITSVIPDEEDFMKSPYASILEINKIINAETDLKFILKTVISYALRLSKAAAGCILLLDANKNLEVAAYTHMDMSDEEQSISRSIAYKVLEATKPLIIADAQSDKDYSSEKSVAHLKLRSVLGIPITSKNIPIGVLYLDNKFQPQVFSNVDLEVLQAFAEQVGIAIHNAQIFKGLESRQVELSEKIDHYEHMIQSNQIMGETKFNYDDIVGHSKPMHEIFQLLDKITDTDLSVFIHGESGTGKELIAKALHFNSQRSKKRFVPVNCGAIPANLMESELFGHKAGSFTGALRDKKGLFEEADGGTLFLDEIGELDINLQVKLLRVLQEGEVTRIGETHPVKFDVRVLSASNKDIELAVKAGKFRQDLFYRLCPIRIDLPSLNNRREDIPYLVKHFVKKFSPQKEKRISSSLFKLLIEYEWPGNVRELENLIQVCCALADQDTIDIATVPQNYPLFKNKILPSKPSDFSLFPKEPSPSSPSGIPIDHGNNYDSHLNWYDYEKRIIAKALLFFGHDVKETAASLGLAITTLYKKIREWGLGDKNHLLYQSNFQYTQGKPIQAYIPEIFRAALKSCGEKPYRAINQLKVSQGYFYKIMKIAGGETRGDPGGPPSGSPG